MSEDTDDEPEAPSEEKASRRLALKVGVGALGVGVGALVAATALRFVAFPLDNETTSGSDAYIEVGPKTQFSAVPVKVDLHADRVDAWNRVTQVRVGSAWVLELDGDLVAYSTVCPHLGCAVDFDPAANERKGAFKCPCHRSAFGLDGVPDHGPAPRPLDRLPLEVHKETELVSIRHVRYEQGRDEKVEV